MSRHILSTISRAVKDLAEELGIRRCGAFYGDGTFLAAASAGGVFCVVLWLLLPVVPIAWRQLGSSAFLALVVVQPVLEELVFRGLLQGRLSRWHFMRAGWRGFTAANGVTALLFAGAHLVNHSVPWAAAVFVPALAFGFFRDRYASIWPGTVLHILYNSAYFVTTGLPGS